MRGAPSVTHTISPKIEYNHCAAKHLPRKFCLVTPSQDASACDSLWFQLEPHQSHFVGDLALLFIKTAGSLQSWLGWSSWQLYSCGLYKLQCGALSQSGTNTARKCKHKKDLWAEHKIRLLALCKEIYHLPVPPCRFGAISHGHHVAVDIERDST